MPTHGGLSQQLPSTTLQELLTGIGAVVEAVEGSFPLRYYDSDDHCDANQRCLTSPCLCRASHGHRAGTETAEGSSSSLGISTPVTAVSRCNIDRRQTTTIRTATIANR